jgi:phosphoglycolate phosphatase-like HAD superfamily hydrolase
VKAGLPHVLAPESGARIVAVATGSTLAKDLVAAGADMVLDDLRDTEATLRGCTTIAR